MANLELLSAAIVGILTSLLLYQITLTIQRLYFHPLSQFPGPKLAAATYWPEIYHDIFHGEGGQLPFAHRKWHEQYGPIIRINPNELHIKDSSFYETLYAPSRPVRKLANWAKRFRADDSVIGTNDVALYRSRRNALNPFFAKRRIADVGPKVQKMCHRLLARLQKEYVHSRRGKILNLGHMWECLATDIVMTTTFGVDPKTIESPEFTSPNNRATERMLETSKVFLHFGILPTLVFSLPEIVVASVMPSIKPILDSRKIMERATMEVQAAHANGKVDNHTLIGSMLQQNLPKQEATVDRLTQEASAAVGAGGETVARTLMLACYHIFDQPAVRDRLVEELVAAIPNPAEMPDWYALSTLPYLSACIEEAIRLAYGVAEVRSRAYDGGDLMYGEWRIPAGSLVGMSNYDVSHDEAIFPDSFSFIPERWLGDPRAPDGKALSRYNVSFGKGMRSCVGMQLAYLELFVAMATFFRSPLALQARLYHTDRKDVEMARDVFVPRATKTTKGVRVVFGSKAGDE